MIGTLSIGLQRAQKVGKWGFPIFKPYFLKKDTSELKMGRSISR